MYTLVLQRPYEGSILNNQKNNFAHLTTKDDRAVSNVEH